MIQLIDNPTLDSTLASIILKKEDITRFDKAINIYPESKNKNFKPLAVFEIANDNKKYFEYVSLSSNLDGNADFELVIATIHEQDYFGINFPLVLNIKVVQELNTNNVVIKNLDYQKSENFYLQYPLLTEDNQEIKAILSIDDKDMFYLIKNEFQANFNSSYYSILPTSDLQLISEEIKDAHLVLFNWSIAKLGDNPVNYQVIRYNTVKHNETNTYYYYSHHRFADEINVFETIIDTESFNQQLDVEIISHQKISN